MTRVTHLLLVALMLLCILEGFIVRSAASVTLQHISYKSIGNIVNSNNSSELILGADNYVNLYIWKDTNVTSLENLQNVQKLRLFSFLLEKETLEQIFIQFIPKVYSKQGWESNYSRNWFYLQAILGEINTECLQGSIFENFDGLVDVSNEFSRRIRMARTHFGYRKKDTSQFINPNDFNVIPLFPINFLVSNTSNLERNFENTRQEMISIIQDNNTITGMECKQVVLHDDRVIERAHGLVNFTSQELELASLVYNITLNYSYSILNSLSETTSLYLNQSQIDSLLWSSSCHYCSTQSCVAENWKWYDTIDMIGLALGFVYLFLMFASLQFLQPALKRRLSVPYVGIVIMMLCFLTNINAFNSGCVALAGLGNLYGISVLISIYTSTVLRFFYLKNLFTILKNSRIPKFHKVMSSTWVGLIVTTILPFVYCFALLSAVIPLYPNYNVTLWNLVGTGIIIGLIAISTLLGFITFLIDVFTHRKGIREKGLRKFLFFDDPFNIRLDLASLGLVDLLLIALVIANIFEPTSIAVFRLFIGIIVYGICGGNVVLIALGRRVLSLRSRANKVLVQGRNGDDFLSSLLKGDINLECYGLFKEYCEKEMSLENIVMMEKLVEVRKKPHTFRIKFLQDLMKDHLETFSIYQVNVSHETRNNLKNLLNELTITDDALSSKTGTSYNGKFIEISVLDDLYNQVMENLRDPYSRFQYTAEFKEWLKVFALQKELDVI